MYELLKGYFKSAEWSLEKCPSTGTLHFQGRGSLFKKMRAGPGSAEIAKEMKLQYFQPTEKGNLANTGYQAKVFSHVAGPWSIKEPPPLKVPDVTYVEAHLKDLPWARELIEYVQSEADSRQILWIYDPGGKNFKSCVLAYLAYYKLVEILPYSDNYKDFMQFAYGYAHKKAYAVNICRGIHHNDEKGRRDFAAFISGLESLKDGFVYDHRNHPKKEQMARPHVIVTANCKPILDHASGDKWKIVTITPQMEFEDLTAQIMDDHERYMCDRRQEWDEKKVMAQIRHKRKWAKMCENEPCAQKRVDELREERIKRQFKQDDHRREREEYFRTRPAAPAAQEPDPGVSTTEPYPFVFEDDDQEEDLNTPAESQASSSHSGEVTPAESPQGLPSLYADVPIGYAALS